jgi:hypothetical protein
MPAVGVSPAGLGGAGQRKPPAGDGAWGGEELTQGLNGRSLARSEAGRKGGVRHGTAPARRTHSASAAVASADGAAMDVAVCSGVRMRLVARLPGGAESRPQRTLYHSA